MLNQWISVTTRLLADRSSGWQRLYERLTVSDFTLHAAAGCGAVYALYALLFLAPGVFVVGYLLNDTFVYTESAYRIANGQTPGVDFTNPMGIFSYVPLVFAYRLTGDLAYSIPISFVIYGLIALLGCFYMAMTRMRLLEGVVVAVLCAIVTAAPWPIGYESGYATNPQSTGANYYNKFGLALVLISAFLVLPAKPAWIAFAKRWDDLAAVALALMAYYTKMPYGMGIVALYLLWRLWIEPSQLALKKAAMALLVGMVAVEILRPGINLGYLSEMRLASGASGGALQVKPLIAYSVRLFPELLILVLLPAALAAWAGRITAKQLVFIGCLTGGSLVLRSLSAQGDQLFTPVAVPIIVAALLTCGHQTERTRQASAVNAFLLVFCLLTYLAPAMAVTMRHYMFAQKLEPLPGLSPRYARLRVPVSDSLEHLDDALSGRLTTAAQGYAAARAADAQKILPRLYADEHVVTLNDMFAAQKLCGRAGNNTGTIDYGNLSASWLGHKPVGAYTYAHIDRGYSEKFHLPAEVMFRDVQCFFDPKVPNDPQQVIGLMKVFGEYIRTNFSPVGETKYWRVLVKHGVND